MHEGTARGRGEGFFRQLIGMARALFTTPERNQFLMLAFALCVVIAATAFGQIRLNAWNHPFYDAIARKDLPEFLRQLWHFAMIAGGLLILNVAQIWLNQMTKLKLRRRLTTDLIELWLGPTKAFRLARAGEIGVNPDQRIHEDARHLVELTTDLGIGLLQSTLLLACFIGVLWVLSEGVALNLFGQRVAIPGYMVWAALIYSGAASWMSWRVGRPLIAINAERYAREADLRVALVRANERNDAIAFYGGEEDEKQRLRNELEPVLSIMRRYVSGVTELTWITAGYGWFTIVAPIVVAAPGFFTGNLTLGGLMMVVGAFNQVQQALRWFVDNFSVIADWRATMIRVSSFRQALIHLDSVGDRTGRIERTNGDTPTLRFDRLSIAAAATCTRLSERHVALKPGERALIIARSGAAREHFFAAAAGLWPWGAGRITLPSTGTMLFLARRPYLPPGTLRTALAYPAPIARFPDKKYGEALERLGLGYLRPSLDLDRRWDRELSADEQLAVHFARLLLHRPQWVLINEALDGLDDETQATVLDIFTLELAESTIVNIGRAHTHDGFFTRVLHLIDDPAGEKLNPCSEMSLPPSPLPAKSSTDADLFG